MSDINSNDMEEEDINKMVNEAMEPTSRRSTKLRLQQSSKENLADNTRQNAEEEITEKKDSLNEQIQHENSQLIDNKDGEEDIESQEVGMTGNVEESEEEEEDELDESERNIEEQKSTKINEPEEASVIENGKETEDTSNDKEKISEVEEELEEDEQDQIMLEDLKNTLQFFNQQSELPQATTDINFIRLNEEYDKIHKLFMQSRTNEKKLVKRCKELTTELNSNAAKVQAALKLSQNDRSTITGLKKEIRKAWKMVEAGSEKEARSKEAISSMKAEIESLHRGDDMASRGTVASPVSTGFSRQRNLEYQIGQEESIKELIQIKESLQSQLETALSESKQSKHEITELEGKLYTLTTERGALDYEVLTLKDLLATKKSESDRDGRAREKLEIQNRQNNEELKKKDQEFSQKILECKQLKEQNLKNDLALKEEKTRYEKFEKENDILSLKLTKMLQEYDEQVLTISSLVNENQNQNRNLKNMEEEVSKYKDELRNCTRVRDSLAKRIKVMEEAKEEAEFEKDALKGINHGILHDLDLGKKELSAFHKNIEALKRERDIAQKNFVRATGATQKQLTVVKLAEQTKRNLEQEIMGYKDEASKMRKLIYVLEKERDRHINDSCKAEQNLNASIEEVKMKEMHIFDSKKKITEMEKKLKEQQSMYENVRAERNLYSKNYIESQDEITEMKRKLKIMGHQIEQLKEEIANKESALGKEKFEHQQIEKEKESLSIQIGKLSIQHEDAQKMIRNQQAEENKLRHIITETDAERLRQNKEYEAVVQERDILGTQLIRRNDELSLLYEKIKIQTSTLNKGEIQYRERLEDIRVLRLEIKKLRREKAILQTETQNVEGLRNEIFKLQREVLRERTRVKVLEEELESPMNIHRWRKLSGSDPSTFELITKIQTLQKRLISKTEEVVEKELIICQKEKLYKEVKEVLQRQPGPEIAEELRIVKEAVKVKMRECKSLASELNMYHSQVNEYKYEIEKLTKELQTLKKKFYESKKKEKSNQDLQQRQEAQQKISLNRQEVNLQNCLQKNIPSGPKFAGGGFNLSTGPHQTVNFHAPPIANAPNKEEKVEDITSKPLEHDLATLM
ncbi:hypothetical protein HK099_003289 [Clydaea vesicula]|uniref:Cilia- and flagella-associated protein 58 central coiled coil domain-containing protein n=1 Tax=Clydaea vesicula TaxID=447962 RepID=A0AAD5U3P1_9FUNG|nr:hypothetical protein HK099_003289 [Clydaea vesicula]